MEDFLKSTSVLVSLPTLVYVGLAQRRNRLELLRLLKGSMGDKMENFLTIPYEFLPVTICLVYGIAYKITTMVSGEGKYPDPETDAGTGTRVHIPSALSIWALTGLSLSLVGRFGMKLPAKMFGFPKDRAHTVHLVAPPIYAAIFLYVSFLMKK